MTHVTVLPDAFRRSWPPRAEKPLRETDRAYTLELGEALERSYRADAHLTAYSSPNGWRLNHGALTEGVPVEIGAVIFDLDGPNHQVTPEWRSETRSKICALFDAEGQGFYYETRGGARVVYRQEEPTVIGSRDDALEWRRSYAVLVANLERRFGLHADPSCADWTRLFRLPRATRDEGGKPENHPSFGDPHKIADLFVKASHEDVERAQKLSRAFKRRTPRDFTPSTTTGDGLLHALLSARGDVGSEIERGKWIVRCPNRAQHTSETDGTSSTVLYAPRDGVIGMLVCLHAHCSAFTLKDVLGFFSDSEIQAARRIAGIERAA